jgi:hypothetical protein
MGITRQIREDEVDGEPLDAHGGVAEEGIHARPEKNQRKKMRSRKRRKKLRRNPAAAD